MSELKIEDQPAYHELLRLIAHADQLRPIPISLHETYLLESIIKGFKKDNPEIDTRVAELMIEKLKLS